VLTNNKQFSFKDHTKRISSNRHPKWTFVHARQQRTQDKQKETWRCMDGNAAVRSKVQALRNWEW